MINIRGANASGKTTLMRQIMGVGASSFDSLELGQFSDANGKLVTVRSYLVGRPELKLPILVVGTYDASKYSGCDKIKSVDVVKSAVASAASRGDCHVAFEGFYVSKSWGPYAELRNRLVGSLGIGWLWAMIHAPNEQFIFDRSEGRCEPGSKPIDKKELAAVCRAMNSKRANAMSAFPKDVLTLDPTRTPAMLAEQLLATVALREAVHG